MRTTSYVKAGSKTGSQGARILYDSNRFELLSNCPETSEGKTYNPSCTIRLPLLKGDSEDLRRRAAYAELRDRATKRKFFVVSAHLDARHSTDLGTDARYNGLRAAQVSAIVQGVAKVNPKGRKVIFGGDINSWQVSRVGHAPHDALLASGFWDTASASKVINIAYGTSNQFATVMKPNVWGFRHPNRPGDDQGHQRARTGSRTCSNRSTMRVPPTTTWCWPISSSEAGDGSPTARRKPALYAGCFLRTARVSDVTFNRLAIVAQRGFGRQGSSESSIGMNRIGGLGRIRRCSPDARS